jgi:hypothetical protein
MDLVATARTGSCRINAAWYLLVFLKYCSFFVDLKIFASEMEAVILRTCMWFSEQLNLFSPNIYSFDVTKHITFSEKHLKVI